MKVFSSRRVYLLIVCLCLIGVPALIVQAQTSNQNARQKKKGVPILSPLQQRGLETLDGLSLEARHVNNAAIRADLQALIGDALWDFDKPNARNIFIDAFRSARTLEDEDEARAVQTQILKHVWRRDRPLAEELMKQLSAGKTEKTAEAAGASALSSQFGIQSSDPTIQQKLDLAKNLLEDDPAAAANLIGDSLQREVSFTGINQLSQLKLKDPETANRIFDRALSQLPSMPTSSALTAAIAMAEYLSPNCALCARKAFDPAVAEVYYTSALGTLRRSLGEGPTALPLKPDIQQKVVQYFHEMQALLALTLTRFSRPTELVELQTIFRDKLQSLAPPKQRSLQAREQNQNAPDRFEQIFSSADSIRDQEQHDMALFNTVQLALRQEPTDEMMERLEEKIEKIETKNLHDKAWSYLKIRGVEKLITSGEFDKAYGLSLKLPDPVTRAKALRMLSGAVAKKGSETLRSSDLLTDALDSLRKANSSIERSQILFKITSDFVSLKDYDHAFDALQFSSGSLALLEKKDFEEIVGEAVPNSLFEYGGTFGRLGNVDFDKTMFSAQSIKWREFRLAAGITSCRGVLSRGKQP
jgi:hypothetical protein